MAYNDFPPFVKGSDTSREAAESMEDLVEGLREEVFNFIASRGAGGVTDHEIEVSLSMRQCSARRRELELDGWVYDSGQRRINHPSGRRAIVWLTTSTEDERMFRAKARAERVMLDAYLTPDDVARQCVACLVPPTDAEHFPHFVIEPSVGGGAFARAIRAAWPGVDILGIDIDPNATGFADCDDHAVMDWMHECAPGCTPDLVCGNPPYGQAQEHIEHALAMVRQDGGIVAMLLRLNFLEGQKRAAFWKAHPFDECFVLSARPSFTGGGTDATAYAFFVWRAGSARKLMHWIFPPESEPGDQAMPPKKSRKKSAPAITTGPEGGPSAQDTTTPMQGATLAPWIVEVRSNVKCETWDGWAVRFTSPKVLIVGANGAGKSRVANAIELACSGRATDVVGRDPKAPAELVALAPPGAGTMQALVAFSDPNWNASWSMDVKADRSAGKPRWSTVANMEMGDLLPVRALEDALHGSADGARAFFLSVIADRITDADVTARLPAAFHTHWSSFGRVLNPPPVGGTVPSLLLVIEGAKAKVREWKAAQKEADSLIQQLGQRLTARPTTEQVNELWSDTIAVLTVRIAEIEMQGRFMQAHAARPFLAQLRAVLAAVPAAPAVPPVPPSSVPDNRAVIVLLEAAATIAQAGIDKHLSTCPICAQGVSAYTYADTRDRARAMIDEMRATHAAQLAMRVPPTVEPTTVEVDGTTWSISAVQTTIAQITPNALEGIDIGPPPATFNVDALVAERDRLARIRQDAQTNLTTMQADQQRWGDVQRARDRSTEAGRQVDDWQRAVEAFSTVRDELVGTAVATFSGEVNRLLPAGDRFGLRLQDDAGREVFQIGLTRKGMIDGLFGPDYRGETEVFHAALSGAEETRVLAAVASVCSRGRGIVIPRERAHDPRTLGEAMRALVAAPGQIILTSTVLPDGDTAGWCIVDVGATMDTVVEPPVALNADDELPWGSPEGEA